MPKSTEEKMLQRSGARPPELWARVESYAARISVVKISHSAAIRDALTRYFDSVDLPAPSSNSSPTKPSTTKRTAKRKA